jgi:hypothetical protein
MIQTLPRKSASVRSQLCLPTACSASAHGPTPPGTLITRKYKGEVLQVWVLPKSFEYEGEVYTSLHVVAKAITGSHSNGSLFFRLGDKGGDA